MGLAVHKWSADVQQVSKSCTSIISLRKCAVGPPEYGLMFMRMMPRTSTCVSWPAVFWCRLYTVFVQSPVYGRLYCKSHSALGSRVLYCPAELCHKFCSTRCVHQKSNSRISPVVLADNDHRQSLHIPCDSFIDSSFIAFLQHHDL